MLYRGINEKEDRDNQGQLLPGGRNPEIIAPFDGKWRFDGKMKFGPCQSNTARAQQNETALYGGSGVSTTRDQNKAVFFATSGYVEDGFVYVIEENLLSSFNVSAHEFSDPQYPFEKEVTLIQKEGGAVPNEVVICKYAVNADGSIK